jgi:hypothetical protein
MYPCAASVVHVDEYMLRWPASPCVNTTTGIFFSEEASGTSYAAPGAAGFCPAEAEAEEVMGGALVEAGMDPSPAR